MAKGYWIARMSMCAIPKATRATSPAPSRLSNSYGANFLARGGAHDADRGHGTVPATWSSSFRRCRPRRTATIRRNTRRRKAIRLKYAEAEMVLVEGA